MEINQKEVSFNILTVIKNWGKIQRRNLHLHEDGENLRNKQPANQQLHVYVRGNESWANVMQLIRANPAPGRSGGHVPPEESISTQHLITRCCLREADPRSAETQHFPLFSAFLSCGCLTRGKRTHTWQQQHQRHPDFIPLCPFWNQVSDSSLGESDYSPIMCETY